MKKAIYHGIRDLRVEEVEEPEPQQGEAKIKVKYCGLCGSDLHEYLHGPFPVSPFGHEACGEIVAVGPGVEQFEIGDRVIAFNKGAYAEYLVAPVPRLLKMPEGMSWERAATFEPLAGAAYAIDQGALKPTDKVLVAGAGPVGLLCLVAARAIGVQTVYVTEISEKRSELARKLGATEVFNPLELKIPRKMKELTGDGVDVAIEAVGIEATLKDSLASTRYRGTVIIQGIFTERIPIHMLGFVTREITMIGTNSINTALALEWVTSGRAAPEAIVTSKVPLDQIAGRGFDVLADDKERDIKILIEP